MAHMDFYDYQTLVEDTPVDTMVVEFRDTHANLVAACIVDRVEDGLSAVYSFFDPSSSRRCLGSYMILWLVHQVKLLGTSHVYLGYWIAECSKMSYKSRFQPLEAYTPVGWRPLRQEEAVAACFPKPIDD
jgi:arginine-tRNA-protein transferase